MSDRLHDAFEVCRAALATGVTLEAALGLYPELAGELRPVLEAWQAMSSLRDETPIPAARLQRSRTRLLAGASQLRGHPARPALRWPGLPRMAFATLAVAAAVLLGWGGLTTASAQSIPGDPLYGLKRANEDLQLRLAAGERRTSLKDEFAQRRSSELLNLLKLGRSAEVEFTGVVRAEISGGWDVDGVLVMVGAETEVEGEIAPGVTVEVEGATAADGSVLARQIRLAGLALEGTVEAIGANAWIISGLQVAVDRSTTVSIGLRLGDRVLALIELKEGGAGRARAILYLGPGSPTPEATQSGRNEWEFEGLVQARGSGAWIIAGQTLLLTTETRLDDSLQVGDVARVKAETAPDGRLLALRIERPDTQSEGERGDGGDDDGNGDRADESGTPSPDSGEGEATKTPEGDSEGSGGSGSGDSESSGEKQSFTGEVTAVSGILWTIGGRQVVVTGDTELEDDPGLGDQVKVEARFIDGQWVAERIEKA
jgi:hypothetical protein